MPRFVAIGLLVSAAINCVVYTMVKKQKAVPPEVALRKSALKKPEKDNKDRGASSSTTASESRRIRFKQPPPPDPKVFVYRTPDRATASVKTLSRVRVKNVAKVKGMKMLKRRGMSTSSFSFQ